MLPGAILTLVPIVQIDCKDGRAEASDDSCSIQTETCNTIVLVWSGLEKNNVALLIKLFIPVLPMVMDPMTRFIQSLTRVDAFFFYRLP